MNILIFPEAESSIYEGAFSQYESNNNIESYINRKGSSHDDIRQIRNIRQEILIYTLNLSSRTGDLLIKEFCGQVDREILVLLDTLPDDINNNIERMSSFMTRQRCLLWDLFRITRRYQCCGMILILELYVNIQYQIMMI